MTDKKKITANDIGPWFLLFTLVVIALGFLLLMGWTGVIVILSAYALAAAGILFCAIPNMLAWAINKYRGL